MKPILIGVPCREVSDNSSNALETLGIRAPYFESVLKTGALPIMIPFVEESKLREYFDLVDGILFTGGEDISPKEYGAPAHEKLGPVSEERDRVELALMSWTLAERKPCLCICRGLQILNVAAGGTLYQDLPSERPSRIAHRDPSAAPWTNEAHSVEIASQSRLSKILGAGTAKVNSLHHQAIKDLGRGLKVCGTAPDGIIEAVEAADGDRFLLAVQWHPETLWQETDQGAIKLFHALKNASGAS